MDTVALKFFSTTELLVLSKYIFLEKGHILEKTAMHSCMLCLGGGVANISVAFHHEDKPLRYPGKK